MTASEGDRGTRREVWLYDDAPILGGAELIALRLARHMLERRPDLSPRIVCPADSELAARTRNAGIEHVPARFPALSPRGVPGWPRAIHRIRSLLAGAGEDAIAVGTAARGQAYLTVAAPLVRRGPAIVHLVAEQLTPARVSGRFAYRRVGSVVTFGENVAAMFRERLPGVPVWKANNFFLPDELARGSRHRPDGKPVLGVVGRLTPEKGILELIEELAAADRWQRMVIAGDAQDPAYAREVEERIGALGLAERVSLLGFLRDPSPVFESIDALVVPSTGTEGQPAVILEALAAGVPCILRSAMWTTDFEGLPVLPYADSRELEARLGELPLEPAPLEEVRRRFGPEQALDAVLAAAEGRT